ncbi:MAG: acyl-CoA thioesterase [Bacteroidales bacterium]|nr:acyl-CoA thioesterase [Bacteroidales bacterium]
MKDCIFQLEMKVRDYECDLQGIVNNANYQHYLEHTRHEFLESLGGNFGKLHDEGIDAIVSRVEINYRTSLKSGDRFVSKLSISKKGPKVVFHQEIYRLPDEKLCIKAVVESVIVQNGVLTRGELFDQFFAQYYVS